MLSDLKPGFLRFPGMCVMTQTLVLSMGELWRAHDEARVYLTPCAGGCYVEGTRLTNAFRWRDSVGPYENRPGHYGDVWNY
jgi:alpha-L-arabinofuranosidase